ncbi:MAG TPA: sensor histidine kinase [Verrucomicrobiae bacterium]|nr:sensor histidine kinase [Verrucomicrobiae bacterium]
MRPASRVRQNPACKFGGTPEQSNVHLNAGLGRSNPSVTAGLWGQGDTFPGVAGGKKCGLTASPAATDPLAAVKNMFSLKRLPYWAGAIAILLGCLSLARWLFGFDLLRSSFPGLVSIKASTALCLIFSGGSLLLQATPALASWQRSLARLLAAIVITVAGLTLMEYVFRVDVGLDRLLSRQGPARIVEAFPGRMSLATGLDFIFLGLALLCLEWEIKPQARYPAQYFACAAAAVTTLAFVGYFYGVESLSRLKQYWSIAFNTALASWLLCAGVLAVRPRRGVIAVFNSDNMGGLLARRMLPAAIVVPLLGGWFSVLGERAGLYGLGFGSALYATLLMLSLTGLVIWAAGALNRADAERRQGVEALRQSNARLQAVREEERTRVAREIHDVLAQELTRLKLDIGWLNRQLGQPVELVKYQALQAKLAGMSEVTDTAIGSVQRIASELRPVVLDSLGLCAAIEWQARDFQSRTGIECRASVPETELRLEREPATALFRILQESLTNVARHANATQVEIQLRAEADGLSLRVRDNGRGVSAAELANPKSVGLVGMRERAALLGGQCDIFRPPQGGTTVEAHLPRGDGQPNGTTALDA